MGSDMTDKEHLCPRCGRGFKTARGKAHHLCRGSVGASTKASVKVTTPKQSYAVDKSEGAEGHFHDAAKQYSHSHADGERPHSHADNGEPIFELVAVEESEESSTYRSDDHFLMGPVPHFHGSERHSHPMGFLRHAHSEDGMVIFERSVRPKTQAESDIILLDSRVTELESANYRLIEENSRLKDLIVAPKTKAKDDDK
jgi:hypothetical protein